MFFFKFYKEKITILKYIYFQENDPITKIEIDNSRNLLYILTEKSSIEVWEIGSDSNSVRRLSKIMQSDIANICSNSLK